VFVINLIVLAYRLVAIIDAYRVAEYMNAASRARRRRPRRARPRIAAQPALDRRAPRGHPRDGRQPRRRRPVRHARARRPRQRLHLHRRRTTADCAADATPSPARRVARPPPPRRTHRSIRATRPCREHARGQRPAAGLDPAWNGTDRLNILLIGSDQRAGDVTHNTDTMIVVSIDPLPSRSSMFSLPRDTVDVPLPPGPAARLRLGLPGQDQLVLVVRSQARRLFPGRPERNLPGYNGLKALLGNLSASTSSTSSRSTSTGSGRSSTRWAA
jgi:hypothetical protein